MKKILGLGVVAILVMAMVGGGTWAYFSDTETTSSNVLTAGTLDLGLANAPGATNASTTGTWDITTDNWTPGQTESGTLYIHNDGTIKMATLTVDFDYTSVDISGYSALNVSGGAPGATDNDTFDKMVKATTATWRGGDATGIKDQTLFQLKAAGPVTLSGGLDNGEEQPLAIIWTFDAGATNGCQGNSVDVTVTVVGTQ